jgi:hypothetical protein
VYLVRMLMSHISCTCTECPADVLLPTHPGGPPAGQHGQGTDAPAPLNKQEAEKAVASMLAAVEQDYFPRYCQMLSLTSIEYEGARVWVVV